MGFKSEITKPSDNLILRTAKPLFKSVRSSAKQKSLRHRECYWCCNRINKGTQYINHQFRYDGKIMSLSFHVNCYTDNH